MSEKMAEKTLTAVLDKLSIEDLEVLWKYFTTTENLDKILLYLKNRLGKQWEGIYEGIKG